jgi:hypothetical protein
VVAAGSPGQDRAARRTFEGEFPLKKFWRRAQLCQKAGIFQWDLTPGSQTGGVNPGEFVRILQRSTGSVKVKVVGVIASVLFDGSAARTPKPKDHPSPWNSRRQKM